eukprot:gene5170-biopygen6249
MDTASLWERRRQSEERGAANAAKIAYLFITIIGKEVRITHRNSILSNLCFIHNFPKGLSREAVAIYPPSLSYSHLPYRISPDSYSRDNSPLYDEFLAHITLLSISGKEGADAARPSKRMPAVP